MTVSLHHNNSVRMDQQDNSSRDSNPTNWLVGWLGFMAYQPLMGYFMPNPVYVYLSNIYVSAYFAVYPS